jgi:hypothetical protein
VCLAAAALAAPGAPAAALELMLAEEIALAGTAYLGDADLGCSAPDSFGVTSCAGGPAGGAPFLPEFRLDTWQITSGPGARLDIRFTVTDLGEPKPNVAGVLLLGPSGLSVSAPAQLNLAASIEIADANGDGVASVQPFPASICGCDTSEEVVVGEIGPDPAGIGPDPIFLPIDLPSVSTAFGTARTESDLVLVPSALDDLDLRLFFGGDVSSGDTANVHLSLAIVPVPEPETGLVVSVMLALLALHARSRRPATHVRGPGCAASPLTGPPRERAPSARAVRLIEPTPRRRSARGAGSAPRASRRRRRGPGARAGA